MATPKKSPEERRSNTRLTVADAALVKELMRTRVDPLFKPLPDGSVALTISELAVTISKMLRGTEDYWESYRRRFDALRSGRRVTRDSEGAFLFGYVIATYVESEVNGLTLLSSCGLHRDFAGVIIHWIWQEPYDQRRELIRRMRHALAYLPDLGAAHLEPRPDGLGHRWSLRTPIDPFTDYDDPWLLSTASNEATLNAWRSWVRHQGATFNAKESRSADFAVRIAESEAEALLNLDEVTANDRVSLQRRDMLTRSGMLLWLETCDAALESFEVAYRTEMQHPEPIPF
jgi:hypothetical protein